MQTRTSIAALTIGLTLLVASVIALPTAQPAQAQCGSQASSCKNCHETQGNDPVNTDGTGWHESHAFGDFCYICHAGNNQATDAEAAHAGMVAPMSDLQAACAQCHPKDLQARADVYAVALGIPAAPMGEPAAAASPAPTASASDPEPAAASGAPPDPLMAANDPDLVDYVDRYNQEVLNTENADLGNTILIVVLVALLGGGLFFVNRREGWITVSFTEKKVLSKEYPPDVLGIADQAEKLNGTARKSLARLLAKPDAATDLLAVLDRLSTDDSSGESQ